METAKKRLNRIVNELSTSIEEQENDQLQSINCNATQYHKLKNNGPLKVCVTGAAGQIAYSLLLQISKGDMFGKNVDLELRLLDIPPMAQALKGVEMELLDCALPLVKKIECCVDPKPAFTDIDVAILVGAFPRQKGMERKDLLIKNADIFKVQGKALNDFASRDVKVVVVGNPANTNCLIAMSCAPNIPAKNFSALTRLDHNRAKAQIALRTNVPVRNVHNVIIWGNHSATQYPDVNQAYINDFPQNNLRSNVKSAINDNSWIENEFIKLVQQRGAAIINARKLSSAASAANAIVEHVRDWLVGTKKGEIVSMAVVSDGSYNTPKGLIYSFPVTTSNGDWKIVQGLNIDHFSRQKLDITAKELLEEKTEAFSYLGIN